MEEWSLKYIHCHRPGYWWAINNIGEYTPQKEAHDLNFRITDDSDGKKEFFHFDLYNLTFLDGVVAKAIAYKYKMDDSPLMQRFNAMKSGAINYFIASFFYDEEQQLDSGYHYDFTNNDLSGKTVFEIKNESGISPESASLYICEREPLFPETIIGWMEKLSMELFGEQFQYKFADADIYNRDNALKHYQDYQTLTVL